MGGARVFDFIIVGAGSAGCILANRLSADPSVRVLLVEAGSRVRTPIVTMPAAFVYASTARYLDWGYQSERERFLFDRKITCPRGRLLGGSSSINAMAFVRGNRLDFDRWAEVAGPDWSYDACLPYFKSLESFIGPRSDFRGTAGPLTVISPAYSNPLNAIFLGACQEAGYPLNADTNGSEQYGFGRMDQTIKNGCRESADTAFLDPILTRKNLSVLTNETVARVIIENSKAIGVEFAHKKNGAHTQVWCSREVILSAGAINSPQLLLLSGIGPAEELRSLGIRVVANLPGVGRRLQDHVDISLRQVCRLPISGSPLLSVTSKLWIGARWLVTKRGPGATSHFEVAGYINATLGHGEPDVQLCFIPLLAKSNGSRFRNRHGFQVSIMLLRPKSEGTLTLRDANPTTHPRLRFNYLSESADVETLRAGLREVRKILRQSAIAHVSGPELEPGADIDSNRQLDKFIRETAKSTHHPCGTCRMGVGPDAVVNPEGNVNNIRSLRVVDASIIPSITSGNINAPTMMVAEKLSAAILKT